MKMGDVMQKTSKKPIIKVSEFIGNKITNIEETTKLAFIFTVISTFICHMVFFMNRWANEDDHHLFLAKSDMTNIGRWMNAKILGGDYLVPIILFIIVMISLGLISVMVVKMFKQKNKLYIFITSLLISTFPVLALGFGYGFMIERYIMGMLCATFAVFITDRYKYGAILGSISLAISIGYYQSYICISIALIMLLIIKKILENKETLKDYAIYIMKFLIMGILGYILYQIILKLMCNYIGISLLSYKGIDKMGSLPPLNQIPEYITRTYYDFINFFKGVKFIRPLEYGKIAQLFLCIINFVLLICIIIKNKVYRKKLSLMLLIVFVILIPLGFNMIDFIAWQSRTSSLNIYQFVFIFIIPFILLEMLEKDNFISRAGQNVTSIMGWICTVCGLLLIWHNTSVSNIYYLKINDYYTSTVQLVNRIHSRIESTEGYTEDTPEMIGNKKGIYLNSTANRGYKNIFLYDQGLWTPFIGFSERPNKTDYKIHRLVSNILGIQLESLSAEEYYEIYNSEEYEQIECWPSVNCIQFINDILVLKIS